MKFYVLPKDTWLPNSGKNAIYLKIDNWNDYSFVTSFYMSLHDEYGQLHEIGAIRIGFKGQTTEIDTYTKLPHEFEKIGDEFFSLGCSIDFYKNMRRMLPNDFGKQVLIALRDIVIQPDIIDDITEESVFSTSLLRATSLSVVKGQYARVLNGQPELTNFNFCFSRPETNRLGGINLSFNVKVESTPSTNIHAIIGRNGVGKTTLLNGMIDAVTARQTANANFFNDNVWDEEKISSDYFASLVSVSFSAFDPFIPPKEQPNPAKGTCYFYIGLKDPNNESIHLTIDNLQKNCVKALTDCFYHEGKTQRWLSAIDKLGSDENFASMRLEKLEAIYRELRNATATDEQSDSEEFLKKYQEKVDPFLSRMSSGHAVILLTITRLVATVEEKTLVLLDEPESHLHPPLLSAFVRALAELLHDRNGIAIIATHSPVVLQEIPRSCVWKIYRVGTNVTSRRPDIETFAENVGVLTSEVFGLEVERSGFHDLLAKSVSKGKTYAEIIDDYNHQLGFEGRAILAALIANRDRSINHDATE